MTPESKALRDTVVSLAGDIAVASDRLADARQNVNRAERELRDVQRTHTKAVDALIAALSRTE
jgi:hypothetical protein